MCGGAETCGSAGTCRVVIAGITRGSTAGRVLIPLGAPLNPPCFLPQPGLEGDWRVMRPVEVSRCYHSFCYGAHDTIILQ